MGTGCSLCCTKCGETICCCSPCCKKCCKSPAPPIQKFNKATSPTPRSFRSVGISPMPQPSPPPLPVHEWEIKVIQTEKIDISSLNRIAERVDFSDIVNAAILLEIDTKKIPLQKDSSKKPKLNQKVSENGPDWHDKFVVHGKLSDILADVKGQTHGCINSTISEDINRNFLILHDINTAAAAILHERLTKIASKEKSSIDQFIQERDDIINIILRKGRSYVNQYEDSYRKLIEKFITILEVEMSKHLDYLQNEIEADKASVFQEVNTYIQFITNEADRARDEFQRLLQQAAAAKRQDIIDLIENSSKDKRSQPLGYEQLRKLNIEVYSTVGKKNNDQSCDSIPERGKFITDIDRIKPSQLQTKRTVYIDRNVDQQQANRNKDS